MRITPREHVLGVRLSPLHVYLIYSSRQPSEVSAVLFPTYGRGNRDLRSTLSKIKQQVRNEVKPDTLTPEPVTLTTLYYLIVM